MKKLSSWYNRTHKIFQFQTTGGYDTFGIFRKSKNGKEYNIKDQEDNYNTKNFMKVSKNL